MKKIYLVVLLIFPIFVCGQNEEVDRRNGFKEIKLGANYDSFIGIKEIESSNPNHISGIWNTSDDELGYFFDNKIDLFELTFDRKTKELIILRAVVIIKKPYSDPTVFNKYKDVTERLIYALGNPNKVSENGLSMNWYGNNTIMSLLLTPEQLDLDDEANITGLTTLKFVVLSPEAIAKNVEKGF